MTITSLLALIIITSCNKDTNIDYIKVNYLPKGMHTQSRVGCTMLYGNWGGEEKEKTINDASFLSQFELKYNNLIEGSEGYVMDARMSLEIHYKNNSIDTLCLGEHFGVLKNGVKYQDDKPFIKFVKNEVYK